MTANSPVTEDELHAYVDGELAPDRRAAVEAWLDSHPEDAARVTAWRAQADAIRARYGAIAKEPVPPRFSLDRIAAARPERRWMRIAAAAALVVFLAGGGAGWFAHGVLEMTTPGRAVTAEAFDAHQLYVVEVRHPVEVPGSEAAHLAQWLTRRVGYEISAPNLETMGLKLVGGRLLPSLTGAGAAFFMYEGANGERFTIYCRRTRAPESALRYSATGAVGSFSWIDRDVGYVVSGPADRARLQKVAEAAYGQLDGQNKTGALPRMLASNPPAP